MTHTSVLPTSQAAVIAIVVNTAWVTLKFRSELIRFLRERGFHVAVITQRDDRYEDLRPLCDTLLPLRGSARSMNPLVDTLTLVSLYTQLARLRPEVVLSFTIKPNLYASLAARALGIPCIQNVTGLGSMARVGGWRARTLGWMYRHAFAKSRHVFFQNEDDRAAMLSGKAVFRERTSVLPGSGVDVTRFQPSAARPARDSFIFAMAARLLREKGVAEFAEAAAIVLESRRNVGFQLWGTLDDNDGRHVSRAEIERWQRAGVLTFHGEARDAGEAFAGADCVVLPTYYPEGTPRTLLEAASLGLPVIATDIPGCRNAVVDGETGFLVQPRNVAALVSAMNRVLDMTPQERSELGKRARERVVAQFDENIVLGAYLAAIEDARRAPSGRSEKT